MDWFDCGCCSVACDCCDSVMCDCCSSIACDCCSVDCGSCPDCGGYYGSLPGGITYWLENWLENWAGRNVTVVGGNCTCEPYVLPTASESVKGGIKVGHSLLMIDETMNVALDTVPSTVEGFMWIHDVALSVSGGS